MSAPIIRIREDSLWSRFLVRCDHDGVISADVYGRPTPMVTWYFDLGEKVIEGERFRTEVEDGGRGHRLVIANVSEELDRRFVTIFAANIHGWDTAMMDLKAFRVYPKYRPSDLRRIPSTIHPSGSDASSEDSLQGNSIRHRRECHSMPRSLPCTPSHPRKSNLVRNQSCRTPRVKIREDHPHAPGILDDPNKNNCKTREINAVLKGRNYLPSENIHRRIKVDKRTTREGSSMPRNRSSDSGFGEIRRSSSATLRNRPRSTTCQSGGSDDAFYDDIILPRDASAVSRRRHGDFAGIRRKATTFESGYGDLGENLWHVTAGNKDRDYLLGKLIRASIEGAFKDFRSPSESREIVRTVKRSRKGSSELNTLKPDDRGPSAKNIGHDDTLQSERVQFDASPLKPLSLLGLDQASAERKPKSDKNKDCSKLGGENSDSKELVDFERGGGESHDTSSVARGKSTARAVEGSTSVMKTAQRAKVMPKITSGETKLLKVKDANQRPFIPLKSPVKPKRQDSAKVHEENSGKRSSETISSASSAIRRANLNAQDPKPHSTVDLNDREVDSSLEIKCCLPNCLSHYDKRADERDAVGLDDKRDETCELFAANVENKKSVHKNKSESVKLSSKSLNIEDSVHCRPRTRVSQTANKVHRILDTSAAESSTRNQDAFANSRLRQEGRREIEGPSFSAASYERKNLPPRKSKTLDNGKKTPEDVNSLKECRNANLGKTTAEEAALWKPEAQKDVVENRRVIKTEVDFGSKESLIGLDSAENDTFSSMPNKQIDWNRRQAPLKLSRDSEMKRSDHKDNKTHRTGQSQELVERMDGTDVPKIGLTGKDSSILDRLETNETDFKGEDIQKTNYKKKPFSQRENDVVPLLDEIHSNYSTTRNYFKMASEESSNIVRNQNFDGKGYQDMKVCIADPFPEKLKELYQDTISDENQATGDENSASEQTDYYLSTLSVTKDDITQKQRLPRKLNVRTLITPTTAGDILCSNRRTSSKNDRVHRMAENERDDQGQTFRINKRSRENETKDNSLLFTATYEDKQEDQLEGTNSRDTDFSEIRETHAQDKDVVTDNVRQIAPSIVSRVCRKNSRKRISEPEQHQATSLSSALLYKRGIRETVLINDETEVNSDRNLGQTDDVDFLQLNDMKYESNARESELASDNCESLDEEKPLPKEETMEQSVTDNAASDKTMTKMTREENSADKTQHTHRSSAKQKPNSKTKTYKSDKSVSISKSPVETPKRQRPLSVKIRSYRPFILQPITLNAATVPPPRQSEVSEDSVQTESTSGDDRQTEERSPFENPLDCELGSRHSLSSSNDQETSSGFNETTSEKREIAKHFDVSERNTVSLSSIQQKAKITPIEPIVSRENSDHFERFDNVLDQYEYPAYNGRMTDANADARLKDSSDITDPSVSTYDEGIDEKDHQANELNSERRFNNTATMTHVKAKESYDESKMELWKEDPPKEALFNCRQNENPLEARPHDNRAISTDNDNMRSDIEAKTMNYQVEKKTSQNFECTHIFPPPGNVEADCSPQQTRRWQEFENMEPLRPDYEAKQEELRREENVLEPDSIQSTESLLNQELDMSPRNPSKPKCRVTSADKSENIETVEYETRENVVNGNTREVNTRVVQKYTLSEHFLRQKVDDCSVEMTGDGQVTDKETDESQKKTFDFLNYSETNDRTIKKSADELLTALECETQRKDDYAILREEYVNDEIVHDEMALAENRTSLDRSATVSNGHENVERIDSAKEEDSRRGILLESDVFLCKNEKSFEDRPYDNRGNSKYIDCMFSDNEAKTMSDQVEKEISLNVECSSVMPSPESEETVHSTEQTDRLQGFESRELPPEYETEQGITGEVNVPTLLSHNKTDEVELTSFEIEETVEFICEDAERSFGSASPKRTADANFPFCEGVIPVTSSISVAPGQMCGIKNKTYSDLENKFLWNYTSVKEETEFHFHDTADLCYGGTEGHEQEDTAYFDTFTDNSLEDMKVCDATDPMHNKMQRQWNDDVESSEQDVKESNQNVDRLREPCSAELKMNRLDFSTESLGTEPDGSNSTIQLQSFDLDTNKDLARCSSNVIETYVATEVMDNEEEPRDGTGNISSNLSHPDISSSDLSTAETGVHVSREIKPEHEKCIVEAGGNLEEQGDVCDDDAYEIQPDDESKNSATFTTEGTVAASVDSDNQSIIHEAKFVETTASKNIGQQSVDEQNDRRFLIQKDECTDISKAQEFMNISHLGPETHNEISCEREDAKGKAIFYDYDKESVTKSRFLKQEEHTEDDEIATVSRLSDSQLLLQFQLPSLFPQKTDHHASEESADDFKTDDDFAPDVVGRETTFPSDDCCTKSPPSDYTGDYHSISNDLPSSETSSPVIWYHSSDDVHSSSSATDEVPNLDRRETSHAGFDSSHSEASVHLFPDDLDASIFQCQGVHDTIRSDELSDRGEFDHGLEYDSRPNSVLLMQSYKIGQSGEIYAGEDEQNDAGQLDVMQIEIENDDRCLLAGATEDSTIYNQFPIKETVVVMNNDLDEIDFRDLEKRPSITNRFRSSSSEPGAASDSTERSAEATDRGSYRGIMPGHSENMDNSYNFASSTKLNNRDDVDSLPVSEEQNKDIVTLLPLTEPDITVTVAKSAEIEDSENNDISFDLKSKQRNDYSMSNIDLSEVQSESVAHRVLSTEEVTESRVVSDLQHGVKENETIASCARETNAISENHAYNLYLMEVENKEDISHVLSVKGNEETKTDFDSEYNSDFHVFSTASDEKENVSQVSETKLHDKDTFYHRPSSEIRIKDNNFSVLQNSTDNKGVAAHVLPKELYIKYDVPFDISKQDYNSGTIYRVQSSSIESEYHSSHIQPEAENRDDFYRFPEPEISNQDKTSDVLQQERDARDIDISFAASSGMENGASNLSSADFEVRVTDDYALATEMRNKNSANDLLETEQTHGDDDHRILLKAKCDEDGFYFRSTEIGTKEILSQVPTTVFHNKVDSRHYCSSEISNTSIATEIVTSFDDKISTLQVSSPEDEIKDDISDIQHRAEERQSVGFQICLSELENKHLASNDIRKEAESVNNEHHDVPIAETADEGKTTSVDIDSKHSNLSDDSSIESEDDDKIFQVSATEDKKKYDTSRIPSAEHDVAGDYSYDLVNITEKDNFTFVLSRELEVDYDDHHIMISSAKDNDFNTSFVHSTAVESENNTFYLPTGADYGCNAESSHSQESIKAKEESDNVLDVSLTELEVRGNSSQAHHTDYECTATSFDHLTENIENRFNDIGLSRTEVDKKNTTSVLQTGFESADSVLSTENAASFSSVLSTEREDIVADFGRKGEHISQREVNDERYIFNKVSEDGACIHAVPSSPNSNSQKSHVGVDFEENLEGETLMATCGPTDSGFFSFVQSDTDVNYYNTENAPVAVALVCRSTEIGSDRTLNQNLIGERILLSVGSDDVDHARNVTHDSSTNAYPNSREFLTSDERSTEMENSDTGSAQESLDSFAPVVVRGDKNVPVASHEKSDLESKINSGPNPTSSVPFTAKSMSFADSNRIDSLRPVVFSPTNIGNFPVEEEEESEGAEDKHLSRRTDDEDDADGEVDNADVNRNTRRTALIAGALGILAIGVAVIVAIKFRENISKDVSK